MEREIISAKRRAFTARHTSNLSRRQTCGTFWKSSDFREGPTSIHMEGNTGLRQNVLRRL